MQLIARTAASGRCQEAGAFKQYENLMAKVMCVSQANAYVVLSQAKSYLNTYKLAHGRLANGRWLWQEECHPFVIIFGCYGFCPDGQCFVCALAGHLLVRN